MPSSFTGRQRSRKTSRSVVVADVVSRILITGGGIGTILAVTGVFAFLVMVVAPLFKGATVVAGHAVDRPETGPEGTPPDGLPMALALGEHRLLAWRLSEDGELEVFRLDNGDIRYRSRLFEPGELTVASSPLEGDLFAFGTRTGAVELTRLSFVPQFLVPDAVDDATREELESLPTGSLVNYRDGIILRTPRGQYRYQSLELEEVGSTRVADGAVRRLDHALTSGGTMVLAVADDSASGSFVAVAVQGIETDDFFTGGKVFDFAEPAVLDVPEGAPPPDFLALAGTGKDFYLAWKDGLYLRMRVADELADAETAERGRLIEVGTELRFLEFGLGANTLVWGSSTGEIRAGFLVRLADLEDPRNLLSQNENPDAVFGLLAAKRIRGAGSPPTSVSSSKRSRVIAAGFEDGTVEIYNITTEALLGTLTLPEEQPVVGLEMAPRDNGVFVVADRSAYSYDIDLMHPEAAFSALFDRVWYEGYGAPEHAWQSSSGHTGFEPKLGLIPLVVGTIKATFYSMLFGAPLAILAAIFSSEFLSKRAKSVIKPTIELMASLPSVVLGFVAAQVIAPFVDNALAGSLALMAMVPLAFAAIAYLFQLLPSDRLMRLARHRVLFFLPALLLGVALAILVGPLFEGLFFAGDLKAWLSYNGRPGEEPYESALGGWALLMLPVSLLGVLVLSQRFVLPWVQAKSESWPHALVARFELIRFAITSASVIAVTVILAGLLDGLGFDPRGSLELWGIDYSVMGSYSQRNSLIVGFVMGFAIIPIIYTLADDALTAVPNHLRSASLGAGATPWQTAVRIVLPTAVSGVSSAIMVGLGRAVGETMIVLMATGNTPILDFNGFSGFRTLAANIAYEIPEAVRDSTHYRTLFLAALVLFVMTFVVNTIAETVRLRFRKRAQLL